MHEVAILARRELKSYFASPIAYVFGIMFLLVVTYLTARGMFVHGQMASMQGFFGLLPSVFLFFLPSLTMRLSAEEHLAVRLKVEMAVGKNLSSNWPRGGIINQWEKWEEEMAAALRWQECEPAGGSQRHMATLAFDARNLDSALRPERMQF